MLLFLLFLPFLAFPIKADALIIGMLTIVFEPNIDSGDKYFLGDNNSYLF